MLGDELEPCGTDPLTGFFRDGCCTTGPEDRGSHTICAVVTAEFLEHQRSIGNDLSTPMPQYEFPGLVPGDRWCVTAINWARAYNDGVAAPVVLASTNEAVLAIVPLEVLQASARRRASRPEFARIVTGQPPAIAPMIRNGSLPSATAAGSGASAGSCERSSSQA